VATNAGISAALQAKIDALKAGASSVSDAPEADAPNVTANPHGPGAEPEPDASAGYTLYIDCYPQGEQAIPASALIERANAIVCEQQGVSHWRCVDYKAAGYISAALATVLRELSSAHRVTATAREAEIESLVWHAGAVVRGVR